MIVFPDVASLMRGESPMAGVTVFPSASTELVKMDFLFDAGYMHQPQPLCAEGAARLMAVSTRKMDAQGLAEFMDRRGVVIESSANLRKSSLTVYTHRRYAEEVLGVVHDMLTAPAMDRDDFEVWRVAKRQRLEVNRRQSAAVARSIWYAGLFGSDHPLGMTATAQDADRLEVEMVREFFCGHYATRECQVVLSGRVDDVILSQVGDFFGDMAGMCADDGMGCESVSGMYGAWRGEQCVEGAQQVSLRVGRVLPQEWRCTPRDFAHFLMLTSVLGGYFGSRLMTNLREDKGYTYGVGANVQQYAGCRVFYITADVAAGAADAAEGEVMNELRRLCETPVDEGELETVKCVLCGDAMRALDGVFERSDRYCDLLEAGYSDLFGGGFGDALREATPEGLQEVARMWMEPSLMSVGRAGAL